jgi:hypothetical protein
MPAQECSVSFKYEDHAASQTEGSRCTDRLTRVSDPVRILDQVGYQVIFTQGGDGLDQLYERLFG